jgi:Bacteriophage head to tail connecting protein
MNDKIATDIIREVEAEQADRGNWDEQYTQIARRILPRHDTFQGRNSYGGERRTEWQFDSLGLVALDRFCAAYNSMATPPNEQWHGLQSEAKGIRKNINVKKWCELAVDELFAMRYAHKANFASQIHEVYAMLGAFGTAPMLIEDRPGKPVNYISCPLSKTWIREGDGKEVNTLYRQLDYYPHRAIEEFGAENLPEKITQAAQNSPKTKFTFYHRIAPNPAREFGKRDASGMAYEGVYIAQEGKQVVAKGGYRTRPFACGRHLTDANETYGRSVAMTALPDIKMRNEMRRTILRSSHRMSDPILLLSDDASLAVFQMRPGFRNRGYLSDSGVELAKQLEWRGDLQPALTVLEETGKVVNDIFFVTLFQILVESPQMTATEVLERMKEKGVLLTPTVGRFQTEFLGGLVERELDIAQARGILPDMPEEMVSTGGLVDVVYKGPLARAQQAEAALGLARTIEAVAPFAQVKPDILDRFDLDTALPELAEINGMPLAWLFSDEQYKAIVAQRQKQKAAETAMAAAQPLATAAKETAQAGLLRAQAGAV